MNAYSNLLLLNAEIFKNTLVDSDCFMTVLERNLEIKFEKIMNKFILDGDIVKQFLFNDLMNSISQIRNHVIEDMQIVNVLQVQLTEEDFEELKEIIFELIDYHFCENRPITYYINERKSIEEDFVKVFNNSANLSYKNNKIINELYAIIINKLKPMCNQLNNHGRNYDLMQFIDIAITKKHFEKINVLVADFEENIIDAYMNEDDSIKDLTDERLENLSLTDLNVVLNSFDKDDSEMVKKNIYVIRDLINIVSVYQSISTNKLSVKIFNYIYSYALIEFKNKIDKTGKYFDYSRVYVNDLLFKIELMTLDMAEHLEEYSDIFCNHIKLYETICVGLQLLYNNFTGNPSSEVVSGYADQIYELMEKDLIENNFYKFATYHSSTYVMFTSYCEMIKKNRKLKLKDFNKIYEARPVMEYQNLTTNILLDQHDFDFMTKPYTATIQLEPIIEILLTLNVEEHKMNESLYENYTRLAVEKMTCLHNIKINSKHQAKFDLILSKFK